MTGPNGTLGPVPVWLTEPLLVVYRGRVRKVYGVIPARHQGHRHYVVRYLKGQTPVGAATLAVGPRGQARFTGVAVRSDHCKLLRWAI